MIIGSSAATLSDPPKVAYERFTFSDPGKIKSGLFSALNFPKFWPCRISTSIGLAGRWLAGRWLAGRWLAGRWLAGRWPDDRWTIAGRSPDDRWTVARGPRSDGLRISPGPFHIGSETPVFKRLIAIRRARPPIRRGGG